MAIDTLLKQAQALLTQALTELASVPTGLYTAISDRVARVKPPVQVVGPAGATWTDPTFNSKLLRVTDQTMGGGSWRAPAMSVQAAWNSDSTKFYTVGESGVQLFTFDPIAMKSTRLVNAVRSQVEPQFSRVSPDTLYVVGGPITRTIQKYSLIYNTYSDFIDIDTLAIPNLVTPRTYVGGVTTSQSPECLMTFFGGYSQDAHFYVLWTKLGTNVNKIINTMTNPGLGFHIHSCAMDMSGRYVTIFPTSPDLARGIAQIFIWDTTLDTFTPVTISPGGHGCLGYGVYVNQDQGQAGLPYDAAQWQLRSFASPNTSTDLVNPVLTPKEVYFADHATWNNAKSDQVTPFFSSTYRYNDDHSIPWRAWDDEVLAIDPTTKGIYRFCHHRSDLRDEVNPLNPYFWYEPIPNVSPDGKWCLFTSNWEKTLGPDPFDSGRSRQDVFMVAIK